MIWQVEIVLYLFLIGSAVLALQARELLVSVVMLTLFSFLIALLFVAMGAVDVAFTEAVVGAGITGVLFVVAIFRTTNRSED
jgi:energy-converting hydrogenase B subunit D